MTDTEMVVDSFADGLATAFIKQYGEEVANTVLDAEQLPSEGWRADMTLTVQVIDGDIKYPNQMVVRGSDAPTR